jgi:hypothetical protein
MMISNSLRRHLLLKYNYAHWNWLSRAMALTGCFFIHAFAIAMMPGDSVTIQVNIGAQEFGSGIKHPFCRRAFRISESIPWS